MNLRYLFFKLRENIRLSRAAVLLIYITTNIHAARNGRLLSLLPPASAHPNQVALCLRFRDEARYLDEWLTYYRAAGIAHFFLYNNFSDDNFAEILTPHIAAGYVTLIDWPHKPASPAAEEDCIRRSMGRFEWIGFLDADEFVVIRDGRSIPEFLSGFQTAPGVALHWYYFGSNGHVSRPDMPVIEAYTRRQPAPNRHVKCFVRPERVSQNKNSHSWFFRGAACAVDEAGKRVFGATKPPRAEQAWINHFYCKSREDYTARSKRKSTLDKFGINYNSRRESEIDIAMKQNNDVEDLSAVEYYRARLATRK
jgi:hypothetical protein